MPQCSICSSKEHNYWECKNYVKSDSCNFLTGYRRVSPFEVMNGDVMEYGLGRDGTSVTQNSLDRKLLLLESVGEPCLLFRRLWIRKDKSNACPCYETPRRQGKARCPYHLCVTPDTKILINSYNSIPITDLKIGDVVLTHKGNFKKIKEVMSREVDEEIYNVSVRCNNFLNFNLTHNHPVYALDIKRYGKHGRIKKTDFKVENIKFIDVQNLKEDNFLCVPLENSKNTSDLTSEQARLLGYYISEGSVLFLRTNHIPADVSFAFSRIETEYINEVQELMVKNFNTSNGSIYNSKQSNSSEVRFFSRDACAFFKKHCGCNNKEYKLTKILSPEIMNMSRENVLAFVGAWINGDGSALKKNSALKINTSKENLARQLFYLLLKNKIHCNINKLTNNMGPKNKNQKGFIYQIVINSKSVEEFRPYTNKVDQLNKITTKNKQRSSVKFLSDYALFPIKQINKKQYKGLVYNLSVEEDESYTIEGYAVHNCYGTGAIGGYRFIPSNYRKDGTILLRFPPILRDSQLNKTQGGLAYNNEIDQVWTMPYPAIYQRDFIVRFDDCGVENGRYEVMQMTYATGFPSNTIVGQHFKLKELDKTDEIYKVSLENFTTPLLSGEKYGPGRLCIDLDIDSDKDGYTNEQEYLDGTNYKDSEDYPQ